MKGLHLARGLLLLVATTALTLAGGCSGGTQADPEAGGQEALPDPQEAGLISTEEAARAAEESIDSSNAQSELEKLQGEIDQG